jgi:hypothetical protein
MEPPTLSLSLEPVPEKQVDYYTNENLEVYDKYDLVKPASTHSVES